MRPNSLNALLKSPVSHIVANAALHSLTEGNDKYCFERIVSCRRNDSGSVLLEERLSYMLEVDQGLLPLTRL